MTEKALVPLAQLRKGLREHRQVHEQWVTHLEHCAGCEDCAAKVVAQVGDLATHRVHVKFYDDALALLTDLEAAQPQKETTMKMEQEIGEMHWKDGWLFKRLDDGSVRIRVWRPFVAVPGPYETAVIPAAEWVSLIHHLGEGSDLRGDGTGEGVSRCHLRRRSPQERNTPGCFSHSHGRTDKRPRRRLSPNPKTEEKLFTVFSTNFKAPSVAARKDSAMRVITLMRS
jgi:hypothetical protein